MFARDETFAGSAHVVTAERVLSTALLCLCLLAAPCCSILAAPLCRSFAVSGVWEHRRALPAGGTISPEACWANQKRIAAMAAGPIIGNVLGAQLIRTSLEQGGRDPASLSTSFMTMGIVAAPQVAVAMAMRNKALNSEMLMAFAYGTLYSEIEAMRVRSNYTVNRGRLPYF